MTVASSASVTRSRDVVRQLTDLLPDHPCTVICTDCQGNHTIITDPGPLPPNALGSQQEFCVSGTCAQHQCGLALAPRFEKALLAATPAQLREFAIVNSDRVSVNEDRDAIQILDCQNRVVASISLHTED